ncbi:MAG: hypothetical protein NZ553_01725 [Caldilinea sp.]|nr:hypothetical protein [Caldilinea sp.]MDW8439170.1 hypothetical protein [Caldilineaceae bacterium]
MRALSAVELLNVWDRGWSRPPYQQAQALLEAGCPDLSPQDIASLSIGQRDRRLLALRELTFGPRLAAVAVCPKCGIQLDIAFNTTDIEDDGWNDASGANEQHSVETDGYSVRFHLPTGADLAALEGAQTGEREMLQRCIVSAQRDGRPVEPAELPDHVVAAIAQCMAEADPQADVQLALTCPACAHAWQAPFDIVAFFWSEVDAWAKRTLREVHALASAYGWREADILALSPRRRQLYLDLVG